MPAAPPGRQRCMLVVDSTSEEHQSSRQWQTAVGLAQKRVCSSRRKKESPAAAGSDRRCWGADSRCAAPGAAAKACELTFLRLLQVATCRFLLCSSAPSYAGGPSCYLVVVDDAVGGTAAATSPPAPWPPAAEPQSTPPPFKDRPLSSSPAAVCAPPPAAAGPSPLVPWIFSSLKSKQLTLHNIIVEHGACSSIVFSFK